MNKILKLLEGWGARPNEALRRMLGDEDFYFHLIDIFMNELESNELSKLIEEEKYKDAFVVAHRMKGSATDLGLAPIFYALSSVTEDLRNTDNIRPTLPCNMEQLRIRHEELKELLNKA